MAKAEKTDGPVQTATALMKDALALIDGHEGTGIIAARLQHAIDAAEDYQSSAPPRA